MRDGDHQTIQIQAKFFEQLDQFEIKYKVATEAQDVYTEIDSLIHDKDK